jgi:DNA-binding MarR family transcriptional regulator
MNKDFILFQIGRVHYQVDKFLMKELNDHGIKGIHPSHGEIIGSILLSGTLSMKEIAKLTGKDKSTVTALVNKLVLKGYVEKMKDHDDKRMHTVRLTKKGKALMPCYLDISRNLRETSYKGFTEKEREQLYNMLLKLEANFK